MTRSFGRVATMLIAHVIASGCGPSTVASPCPPPTAGAETAEATRDERDEEPASDSLDALVRAEGARLCAAGPLVDLGPEWTLPCDALTARTTGAGAAPLEALAVDYVAGGQLWSVLAVRGGGETRVGTLASGWSPGIGGHSAEGTTRVEARDVVPGGAPEIIATFTGVAGDSDMGSCDHRGYEVTTHVLCSVDSGALRCATFRSRSMTREEHTVCGDVRDADGDGDREEPLPGEREIDRRTGFELALELDEGRVTLTPSRSWSATDAPPVSGVISIDELLARGDLEWTAGSAPVPVLAPR